MDGAKLHPLIAPGAPWVVGEQGALLAPLPKPLSSYPHTPTHPQARPTLRLPGIFPLSAAGFEHLQAAMERLTLNDASGAAAPALPVLVGLVPPPLTVALLRSLHSCEPLQGLHAVPRWPLPSRPPAVTVRRENSNALGAGFRCGFLGLLHMDVSRACAGALAAPPPAL